MNESVCVCVLFQMDWPHSFWFWFCSTCVLCSCLESYTKWWVCVRVRVCTGGASMKCLYSITTNNMNNNHIDNNNRYDAMQCGCYISSECVSFPIPYALCLLLCSIHLTLFNSHFESIISILKWKLFNENRLEKEGESEEKDQPKVGMGIEHTRATETQKIVWVPVWSVDRSNGWTFKWILMMNQCK